MKEKDAMKQLFAKYCALTLAFCPLAGALGQGTIQMGFDGPPQLPPGGTARVGAYRESGVLARVYPGFFTRRMSGGPEYPDNGSAYLQSSGSGRLFFTYGGDQFTPVSVDLALYSTASLEPVAVQFVGYGYGGADIGARTEFTVGGVVDGEGRPAFQTFYFGPEFRRLYFLEVALTPLWSLDNLVVIPEPSAGALFALGTLTLCLLRRRFSVCPGCTHTS